MISSGIILTFIHLCGLALGIGAASVKLTWTTTMIIKLVLVLILWLLGPYIDNVVEPKFKALSPDSDQNADADFNKILNKYLAVESLATFCFCVITPMGIVLYE